MLLNKIHFELIQNRSFYFIRVGYEFLGLDIGNDTRSLELNELMEGFAGLSRLLPMMMKQY